MQDREALESFLKPDDYENRYSNDPFDRSDAQAFKQKLDTTDFNDAASIQVLAREFLNYMRYGLKSSEDIHRHLELYLHKDSITMNARDIAKLYMLAAKVQGMDDVPTVIKKGLQELIVNNKTNMDFVFDNQNITPDQVRQATRNLVIDVKNDYIKPLQEHENTIKNQFESYINNLPLLEEYKAELLNRTDELYNKIAFNMKRKEMQNLASSDVSMREDLIDQHIARYMQSQFAATLENYKVATAVVQASTAFREELRDIPDSSMRSHKVRALQELESNLKEPQIPIEERLVKTQKQFGDNQATLQKDLGHKAQRLFDILKKVITGKLSKKLLTQTAPTLWNKSQRKHVGDIHSAYEKKDGPKRGP